MNVRPEIAADKPAAERAKAVSLPLGILGFEHLKQCLLIANPAEQPFQRLQAKDDPALAFLVVEPGFVLQDYRPDLPDQDVEFLGLNGSGEAQLFSIVTVREPGRATINLKGPVVFNRTTGVGKQVILNNAADYSVQHPLPVTR